MTAAHILRPTSLSSLSSLVPCPCLYSLFSRLYSLLHSFTQSLFSLFTLHFSLPWCSKSHSAKNPPFSVCNPMNQINMTVFYLHVKVPFVVLPVQMR